MVIHKNLINEFKSLILENTFDEQQLRSIVKEIVIKKKPDLMKFLIRDYDFRITDQHILSLNKITNVRNLLQMLEDIGYSMSFGEFSIDTLNKIIMTEYHFGCINTINQIINTGFDVNRITKFNKRKIICNCQKEYRLSIIKLLLDNGLKLDFINKNILADIIKTNTNLFKLLVNYNLNIKLLDKINIPQKNRDDYDMMTEYIDPKKIFYIVTEYKIQLADYNLSNEYSDSETDSD